MKNKIANNTSKRIAAAGTNSNTKFKWSDDFVQDLLKALSSFKTVVEFQKEEFNANKPRQYEEVRKEIVEINKRYVEYFGAVSFSALIFSIGCLTLLFLNNISFLIIFSDIDNR